MAEIVMFKGMEKNHRRFAALICESHNASAHKLISGIEDRLYNWENSEKPENRILNTMSSVVLACYLLHYHCKLIAWIPDYKDIGNVGAMLFLDAAFFAALFYVVLCVLQKSIHLHAVLPLIAALVLALRLWPQIDYDWRCWAMNLFLIFTARGKRYNRILFIWLGVYLFGLVVALTGVATGFAFIQEKRQNYPVGYALGYIHTNNASRMLLWIAFLLWLLQKKQIWWKPVLFFGCTAAIAAFHTRCRTVAVLALGMMVFAVILQGRKQQPGKTVQGLLTAAPILCLLLSVLLSLAVVPLIPRFRSSVLWNMFSRFVQNNIALREYGVHWTGHGIDTFGGVSRVFYGETIVLSILDNAYVPWLIRYGILLTALVLWAYCRAIRKALQNENMKLVLVFVFIAIYGLMEPATTQFQYNFAFIYLLAKDTEAQHGGQTTRGKADYGRPNESGRADPGIDRLPRACPDPGKEKLHCTV